jgi:hypothetical protein
MSKVRSLVATSRMRVAMFSAAMGVLLVASLPSAALATETETEKGVHEVATQVSTEGVTIVLAVLTALVGIIVAIIIIPKAIGLVKRFL